MREYTSIWQTQTVPFRWPLGLDRILELPLPVWGLVMTGAAIAAGTLLSGGLPRAHDPLMEDLQLEIAGLHGEIRDLKSEAELSSLEIERLRRIQGYSGEFGIPADLATQIYDIALAEEIDPELGFKLIRVESGFRRTVVSPMGAIGYTQIKPSTARWMDPTVETRDLFDTRTNLHLGFRYLNYLLEEYNGDMRLALLAYNRGPTRVGDLLSLGIDPANGYAKAVLGE